ncbi:hypothetical protein [Borreliella americana]|nr:hypothetical protein [Borreliella americana]
MLENDKDRLANSIHKRINKENENSYWFSSTFNKRNIQDLASRS